MSYITHERIRVAAGFQNRNAQVPFRNQADGNVTHFYVDTDDYEKIVPDFGTGNTLAGVSDVKVFVGLSGSNGLSQLGVSSIDIQTGLIEVSQTVENGASLVVTFSSSAIPSHEIDDIQQQVDGMIDMRLGECYSLPIENIPNSLKFIAEELAKSILLTRPYGINSRYTGEEVSQMVERVNEYFDRVCSEDHQLVDSNGNLINKLDKSASGNVKYVEGGKITGRVFDIEEEQFKKRQYQRDLNPRTKNASFGV